MALKLYNTRTRRKEVFEPLDSKAVRMYVCGPTVYDFAHIGNARPVIVFDVLFRLLRHLYGPNHVTYVRNITDVDDKINARAAEEGVPIRELTERTAAQFHADVAALGALPPTVEPRATEHIPEMIALIRQLIEGGHAYAAEGHVLFDVPSDPHYGELARRSTDEMRAGARVEVAPYKRDPMDFVLWKPSTGSEPGWESPWGYGRPGWHLECSAMSDRWLWEEAKPSLSKTGLEHPHEFDIHGGGIDLLFPHHENEAAQSTCAHGTKIMAKYWMHNGHLQVEGQKMSKSLGNFVTIHELLSGWKGFRWPGTVIRYAMLSTHYRKPQDWTLEKLEEATVSCENFKVFSEDLGETPSDEVLAALCDDLNTPLASAELHKLLELSKSGDVKAAGKLRASCKFLGLNVEEVDFKKMPLRTHNQAEISQLIDKRNTARKVRNWAEADRIRDELSAMGIALKDAKNPVTGEIETTWEVSR
jgi:cysteinyl-tRNA synthetase